MTHDVGVKRLGAIGRPIGERLVAAGHRVAVYDVRPEPLAALALTQEVGLTLFAGAQASLIADAGVATGHDNVAL